MPERAPRVLNVNDDPATRYVLTRTLRQGAFDVIEAETGEQGLELLARHAPDLVVLDVKLPGISGFEVCRRIKADPKTSSIPVLQISASFVKAGDRVQGLEGGADAYLAQPVEAQELIATARALLRMRAAESASRAAAQRWQATFDAIGDGVCLLDLDGRVMRGNVALASRLGVGDAQALIGRPFVEILGELAPADREALARLGAPGGERVREIRLGPSWLRISADPVLDEQGVIVGGVRVVTDLTDKRRMEDELRRRADDLAALDKRKDEFLAMLAHELRNPLAAVFAGMQVLERIGSEDPKVLRMQALVSRQLKHLSRLVDDLLDVSRITRGKIELRKEKLDLVRVAREVLQVLGPSVEARRHQLEASMPLQPVWLNADPGRIQQILTNLLDNAIKYTDPGGHIFFSVERAEQGGARTAVIRVRDTGVGMSPELVGRVFDMFVQAEQSLARSRGGLGIGLTLVRSLSEMHGGTVTATSAGIGKGSEFAVRLPLVQAGAAEPARPWPAQPEQTASGGDAKRSVLLVEDNPDTREALSDLLGDWGYTVETVEDGSRGVQRALEGQPHVALVDIGLPGLDGYQVARQIRASPAGQRVFLIALTGYGGSQQRQQALEAGFDLHLVKPVDPDQLMQALEKGVARASRPSLAGSGSEPEGAQGTSPS